MSIPFMKFCFCTCVNDEHLCNSYLLDKSYFAVSLWSASENLYCSVVLDSFLYCFYLLIIDCIHVYNYIRQSLLLVMLRET